MRDDGADGEPERRDEDQKQRDRHDGHGEGAAAPQPRLHRAHERPGGDDQGDRPDRCGQERLQDPQAGHDQAADDQHAQRSLRQIVPHGLWLHGSLS
jgi:hypothetical protein